MNINFKRGFEKTAAGWGSLLGAGLGGAALGALAHRFMNRPSAPPPSSYFNEYSPQDYGSPSSVQDIQSYEAPPPSYESPVQDAFGGGGYSDEEYEDEGYEGGY